MNPLAIRATNYRTFETLELDLPSGAVAVLGENGAGKSSLVNVVDLALFGADGRSWAPYLTQGVAEQRLELELTFEHGGDRYRVRRGYSGAGKGKATLDLERWLTKHPGGPSDDFWDPETRESIDATQTHLEELLGLTRETFRASSMLVQGDGAAFTDAAPRDRKRILAKILGLDRFDRLLELCRRDIRELDGEIAGGRALIAQGEATLERLDEVKRTLKADEEIVGAATKDLADAQGWLEAAAATIGRADESRATRDRLLAESLAAGARLQPLEDRWEAADRAERDLGIVRDELAGLSTSTQTEALEIRKAELEQTIEAYRAQIRRREELQRKLDLHLTQRQAIRGRANELQEQVKRKRDRVAHLSVETSGDTCELCGQTLGEEARVSTIAKLRQEADELEAGVKDLVVQANEIELPELPEIPERPTAVEAELALLADEITGARQDDLQRARLEERAGQLEATIRSKPSQTEIADARLVLANTETAVRGVQTVSDEDYARLKADCLRFKARVDEERSRLQQAREDAVRQQTELARLEQVAEDTEKHRQAITTDQARLDLLKILERAYGRDGIPALIVSQAAIPSIELEASRILAELGTSYRVELRTEKALAGGGIADALDVVIVTETGERPYETFSGGERTRLNLALRIGLARLLASRRGAESRLLAIDEPEFLDNAGTAALATVLQGLTGDFDKVFLISHVPDLRDRFDASIEVVKGPDGLSRIGGS